LEDKMRLLTTFINKKFGIEGASDNLVNNTSSGKLDVLSQ